MSEIRDEKIGPAVVVIIANTHALTPSALRYTRLRGALLKWPVAVVVEEGGRRGGRPTGGIEPGSIHQKYVVPTVTIVVEDGHSITGGLENKIFVRQAAINVLACQTRQNSAKSRKSALKLELPKAEKRASAVPARMHRRLIDMLFRDL